jgi:hypothetical protein
MMVYGEMDVQIHVFFTSALVEGEWSASPHSHFTPGTHWTGGYEDPRTGLDHMEKRKFFPLPGLELQLLSRPACSQSLYRLCYPSSFTVHQPI